MDKAASLCIMVLFATAVVNSASTVVHERIPAAGRGRGLNNGHFMKRAAGFWVAEDGRKSITADGRSMVGDNKGVNTAAANAEAMSTFTGRTGEEDHKFAVKEFKYCLTSGPCHKKKLVCPKKCNSTTTTTTTTGGSMAEKLHISSQCIFDCNKCVAQCASV